MARSLAPLVFLFASSLGLTACPANEGQNPPADQFYFPVAAAIDGAGRWLYVVNSDFDLRYNGGTVMSVDLSLVRAAVGAQAGPGCQPDIDPSAHGAFYCPAAPFVRVDQTRRINPFAVDAVVADYPAGPGHPTPAERLYVLVRGDGSITWFNSTDGALDCGNGASAGQCADSHRVGIDPSQSFHQVDTLPPDPSSLSVDPDRGWITVINESTDPTFARATIFRDTAVTLGPGATTVELINEVLNLPGGLSSLALVPRPVGSTARSTWLAVSNSDPSFTVLQAYPGSVTLGDARPYLYLNAVAPIVGLNTGANNRAVAIDPRPSHGRAFVVSRAPEALLTVDLSNINFPVVTDAIPVAPGPSRMLPLYDPSTGHTLVYVVSYDARKIYVVDPDSHAVIDEIFTNRGPHKILVDPTTGHPFLYVLDFLDSTVEVIDIRPTLPGGAANPTFHRRVLTIGVPNPPQVTS